MADAASERIASALERIADALERITAPTSRPTRPAPVPVSDLDRAEAKRVARRMGLVVRESKR